MIGSSSVHATGLSLLLIGAALLWILAVRLAPRRPGMPAIVLHIAAGTALAWLLPASGAGPERARELLALLAEAGLVLLLFRAGLDADLKQLRRQLPNAAGIWFWNVVASALLGWLTARHLVGLDVVGALFVTVALTATSVGVPVGIWSEAGRLDSREGSLLLDVAELDDLSTIVLMALLVAAVPL
ncbi:MAG: cation:proton antiporter, partial [Wenzhouxiangellaceae bacterium]|nr:cation:proton antiporter [Wenzhouxiangellaceae bacterium]